MTPSALPGTSAPPQPAIKDHDHDTTQHVFP